MNVVQYILQKLDALGEQLDEMKDNQSDIKTDIAVIKNTQITEAESNAKQHESMEQSINEMGQQIGVLEIGHMEQQGVIDTSEQFSKQKVKKRRAISNRVWNLIYAAISGGAVGLIAYLWSLWKS